MSLLSRFFREEARTQTTNAHPRDPALADIFGGGSNTSSGVNVNAETAMQVTAVYACIRILSTTIASMPLEVYRKRVKGGRDKASDLSIYKLLHTRPNKRQTSFEWREMSMAHVLLRGNAYSYIEYDNMGEVAQLIPLHPSKTRAFYVDGDDIAYSFSDKNGKEHIYLEHEVLHLRGLSLDGVNGIDPIGYAKETIGLSIAADRFGAKFFGNGTVIDGTLESDTELSEEAYERLKTSWSERHSGHQNAHKPAILEGGLKWKSMTIDPDKAQFLETRRYQIPDIARLYGVPPHMLADVTASTSFGSGIESQQIGYLIFSAMPWLCRLEQRFSHSLLDEPRYASVYIEFNAEGILRGDSKARGEFYKTLFMLGSITPNQIREKENMNPYDEGDEYYIPLNMAAPSDSLTPDGKSKLGDAHDGEDDSNTDVRKLLEHLHSNTVAQAAAAITSCETRALERMLKACDGDVKKLEGKISCFYKTKHPEFVKKQTRNLLVAKTEEIAELLATTALTELLEDLTGDEPIGAVGLRVKFWQKNKQDAIRSQISDLSFKNKPKGDLGEH